MLSGEQVYAQVCKTCHEGGIAGAHKFGDKAAWAKVIAQGEQASRSSMRSRASGRCRRAAATANSPTSRSGGGRPHDHRRGRELEGPGRGGRARRRRLPPAPNAPASRSSTRPAASATRPARAARRRSATVPPGSSARSAASMPCTSRRCGPRRDARTRRHGRPVRHRGKARGRVHDEWGGSGARGPAVVAAAAPAAAPAAPAAVDGKKVYDTACIACHAAGIAGAPKHGDKAAWAPRIGRRRRALRPRDQGLQGQGRRDAREGRQHVALRCRRKGRGRLHGGRLEVVVGRGPRGPHRVSRARPAPSAPSAAPAPARSRAPLRPAAAARRRSAGPPARARAMKRDGSQVDAFARALAACGSRTGTSERCARVMPTYISRRSSSSRRSSTASRCGRMPSSSPTRNTCGNSRPFAACSVDSRTASGSSSSRPSSIVISAMVCVSSSRFLPSASPLRASQPTKSGTLLALASRRACRTWSSSQSS